MNLELFDEKRIKKLIDNTVSNKEYELEVVFYKDKLTSTINYNIFNDIFQSLKTNKEFLFDEIISLDIFLEAYNIRISIIGRDSISKYLNSEDINKIKNENIIFLKKTEALDKTGLKLNPVSISDYNLKMKIKKELQLSFNDEIVIKIKKTWLSLLKTFRYKKRSSFIDLEKMFSYDLTLIKSDIINNNSTNFNKPQFYNTLKESNILKNKETYEIELEFIGNKTTNKLNLNPKVVYEKLYKYIFNILVIIQKTDYILSNSKKLELLNSYYKLINGNLDDYRVIISKLKQSHGGIGPKFVSLNIDNLILNNPDTEYCIRNGYCVTEKVDGERQFLYINGEGRGYLLNNALEFKDTNLHFPDIKNCIYDGELVLQDKLKNRINHYLIFDCYFFNEEDIRHLPLKTSDTSVKLDSRLEKAKILSDQYKKVNNLNKLKENDLYLLQIFRKTFRSGSNIFKSSNDAWNACNDKDYMYVIDGLIYTPLKSPVLDKYNSKDKFYSGKTWKSVFKWKPPEHNTIDFLVRIQQEKGKDLIKYYKKGEIIKKYKTLLLFVGNNTKNNKMVNPYSLLFNNINDDNKNEYNKNEYNKNEVKYQAVEFIPFEPVDPYAYIANIFLTNVNGDDIIMPLNGGVPIKDGMIVEMFYDVNDENEWRWKPRNIRFDKTKLREQGQEEFGNNFYTACNIWKSYFIPITENMIFKGLTIPESNLDLKTIYYHSEVDRKSSYLIPMRDFHNLFIKDILYKSARNLFKEVSLLELGCGKGGDLNRMIKYNYNLVVGIDLFLDNIENKNDGCIVRYLNIKDKKKGYEKEREKNKPPEIDYNTKMFFLQGDCGKNIKSGNFTDNMNYKNIYEILWNGNNNISNLGKIDKELLGICANGFNVISCQFALHYFFKNETTFNNFLNNLEENIKDDGIFIGTCFDGKTIYNKLKHLDKNNEIKYEYNDKLIWSIKKNYSENEFKNDESSLGMKIDVFVSSIGGIQTEYLVNFDYFINKMSERGFKLLDSEECNKYSFNYGKNNKSSDLFDSLYYNLITNIDDKNKYGLASNLKNDKKIQEYSFLNRWFIFKKYKSYTIQKIKVNKKQLKKD